MKPKKRKLKRFMNKKTAASSLILLVYCQLLFAQISEGGNPVSFLYPLLTNRYLQPIQMPAVDEAALRAEDAHSDHQKEKPKRFGKVFDVALSPENDGILDQLPNGDKIWRLAISSANARSINLVFSKYKLPAGAQLFLYNADHSEIYGAFTSANNQADEMLGTTLISGNQTIVEYYEPAWVEFAGKLEIGKIVHGYRSPGEGEDAELRGFGDSEFCQNNVNCAIAADWHAQKRAVCRIVNGGDWCTGGLVNNTNNDGTPYVLSANHCFSSNIGTWVFWFNWESDNCSNPSNSPAHQSVSGATLKARNSASDFLLLLLNTPPPLSFDAFYGGWDRSGNIPQSGTCIHHPSGDIKKISFDTDPLTNGTWTNTPSNSHWITIWDDGVTEPGSSGSLLFDQNKRIVGQLHGGASSCATSTLDDQFGKFSLSWSHGSTVSTRLSDWLDPTNTGLETLDGYNAVNGDYLSISPANQNVPSDAGNVGFTISSNTAWNLSTTDTWLSFDTPDGTNNAVITVSYDQNTSLSSRTGVITITYADLSKTITVTQQGATMFTCENDNEPQNKTQGSSTPTIPLNIDKFSQIASASDIDWWKFSLGNTVTLNMTLNSLPADFDLDLRRGNGDLIASSFNDSTAAENIEQTLTAGVYFVRIFGYNGAFDNTDCYKLRINTSANTGNEPVIGDKHTDELIINLLPNPADTKTTVEIASKGYATADVVDVMGRILASKKGKGIIELDLANLHTGIYFVRVKADSKTATQKLIIQR